MTDRIICRSCKGVVPQGNCACPHCRPDQPGQADYAVQFNDFGDCVGFLSLVLQNHAALHIDRNDFDSIVVSGSREKEYFTILMRGVHHGNLDLLQRLARAPGAPVDLQGGLGGELHTINDLLQRIRLIPRTESPGANGIAVALFGAQDRQYRDWHTQLLDMGCGGIQAGFVERDRANDDLSHLLLVDHVPTNFDPPRDWAQGQNHGSASALTFYRMHNLQDCRFYVEWDYECPLGAVDHLYDLTDAQYSKVLICADSPRRERGRGNGRPPAQMEPYWLCLEEHEVKHIFQFPETPLCLPQGAAAHRVDLKARPPSGDAVLDLYVKRDSRSAAATPGSIETDIAWHQRAIEDLTRDKRTAHTVRQEGIYLAFLFRQVLATDAETAGHVPALNPNFRQLLEQPYTHLRHMNYGFYDDPFSTETDRYGLHVVIDTHPGTYSQLLTQLADDVFIQRAEWHEWGLPLFVRYGDEIRPRLEHVSLVPHIRKLLWDEGHVSNEVPILLRTLPRQKEDGERQAWETLYVHDAKPLTSHECFQFLNDRFSAHLLSFRKEIPGDIARELKDHIVQVTKQGKNLSDEICKAADARITEAETHWQTVERGVHHVEAETQRIAGAVNEIEHTIESSPTTWHTFFQDVLKSNKTLMHAGLEAAKEYQTAHDEAIKAISEYEHGLQDVKAKLTEDNRKLDDRRTELTALDKECAAVEAKLKTSLADVSAQQVRVQKKVLLTNGKVAAELSRTTKEIAQLDAQVKEVETKVETAREAQQRLLGTKARLAADEAELKKLAADNSRLQKENEETKQRLAKTDEDLRKARAALDREQAALKQAQIQLIQKQMEYEKDEKKLRQDEGIVSRQTTELGSKVTTHNREWDRVRRNYDQVTANQKMLETHKKTLTAVQTQAVKMHDLNAKSGKECWAKTVALARKLAEIQKELKKIPGAAPSWIQAVTSSRPSLSPGARTAPPAKPSPRKKPVVSSGTPSPKATPISKAATISRPPVSSQPAPWYKVFWHFWKK